MRMQSTVLGAAAVTAAVILAGCSSSGSEGTAANTSAGASDTTSTAAADQAQNDADVMFVLHMIPHHSQAVEMSDMLLAKQGIDPRLQKLASEIKAAQGPEIEQMQGWLNQWGNPPMPPMPSGDADMPGMPGMSGGGAMEGMMSEQDMAALQNAQGVDASKLFLTQMIEHHEGAIAMARTEVGDGQYPEAVALARSIESSQQQEIDTMNGLLGSLS